MKKIVALMSILVISLAVPAMSYANPMMGGDMPMMKKHMEEKRDAAVKEADIDQKKKDAVMAVFKKYDTQREALMKDMKTIRDEIKKLTDEGKSTKKPNEAAIGAQLDKMEANMDKMHEIQKAQIKEIKAILKPSEQVELMSHLMKGMKGKHDKKGGPGGPGGPGEND